MIYDRFKKKYIDEKDIDPIAPPERYAPDPEVETIEPVEVVRKIEITIDYDRLEQAIYAAVYQAIKSVEGDHLREV